MNKIIIETLSKVDENAKITGIAALPRISRNNRLYLKSELQRADGVRADLNWDHGEKIIGYVNYHYNPELEQLLYEGEITDLAVANLARNKTLFTSIEATPETIQSQCFTANDCVDIALGLHEWKLALTEMPGIPETTVQVIESYKRGIKEDCMSDCLKHKSDMGKPIDDRAKAICHSECEEENFKLKKELEQLRKILECPKCGGIKNRLTV